MSKEVQEVLERVVQELQEEVVVQGEVLKEEDEELVVRKGVMIDG
jgi:hypothetical protein